MSADARPGRRSGRRSGERWLILGLGYAAGHLAARLRAMGAAVAGTTRDGRTGSLRFDDASAVRDAIGRATHILSSVPPARDGGDPVLAAYADALGAAPAVWTGYWSATGVYGDTGGAWVDEGAAPVPTHARTIAERAWWAARPATTVLRLPGIYGPGRGVLDRLRDGTQQDIIAPGQVFSRVHVDDIAGGTLAAADARGSPGVAGAAFNIADDLPAAQSEVIAHACRRTGLTPPPRVALADADLSPMGRRFFAECRRIANGRARRLLGWRPIHPTYVEGLDAILAAEGAGRT